MKTRLLLTLAGLAIGFALPTFAQQTNTPDPKLRDELVAFQPQNGAPMRWQGHCLDLCVREGDAWKWRVNTWNAAGPPTPAQKK